MVVANACGAAAAAAATTTLLRPSPSREARHLSLAGPALRRSILRAERGSPSLSCRCSNSATTSGGDDGGHWDWNRWSRHFSDTDQAESLSSALKFQLQEAVEKEDFFEAAKLKRAIEEATSKDVVAEVLSALKNAIKEERYHDASRLSKLAGSRLVVALQRVTENLTQFPSLVSKTIDRPAASSSKYSSTEINPTSEVAADNSDDDTAEKRERNATETSSKDNINNEDSSEEVLDTIINFLKERIPGFKVKVVNVTVPDEIKTDTESLEQLVKEDDEKNASSKDTKYEDRKSENIQGKMFSADGDSDSNETKDTAQVFVGGVTYNKEDDLSKSYMRVPAEMDDVKKDSFILHMRGKSVETGAGALKPSKVRVAAVAAQSASDLMPSDLAKAILSGDKAISKVSKEVREVIKLAFSHAQRRNRLSKTTFFNRIISDNRGLDPFEGLYVGAFGPYGTEVVQLRRKYGNWNDVNGLNSDMNFFEYVEAIKLTGDLNVPAGQVTFRAKIGKKYHLPKKGLYPEELGVVSIYKGQGQIAEPGFTNPRWVDGELLQLSGKGLGPHIRDMLLGFLYVVPEQSYMVLFQPLRLPD
ncbi:protein EXECUTER 2, chloroplastic-like isoform X2 [Musa acuminata AAA Group]|uniref:protein EXECUTER 2, chloroplastic-like isoform X2 n=1 Tax=Musa acuminata AAA Group TaxID=214697 RepID=UPI0031E23209